MNKILADLELLGEEGLNIQQISDNLKIARNSARTPIDILIGQGKIKSRIRGSNTIFTLNKETEEDENEDNA